MPIAISNLVSFLSNGAWGYVADMFGRRWAMIIPAVIGVFITPFYLLSDSYALVSGAFIVQGAFLGAIYGQNPSYLSERFPTEVAGNGVRVLPVTREGQSGPASPVRKADFTSAITQPPRFHLADVHHNDGRGDRVHRDVAVQP